MAFCGSARCARPPLRLSPLVGGFFGSSSFSFTTKDGLSPGSPSPGPRLQVDLHQLLCRRPAGVRALGSRPRARACRWSSRCSRRASVHPPQPPRRSRPSPAATGGGSSPLERLLEPADLLDVPGVVRGRHVDGVAGPRPPLPRRPPVSWPPLLFSPVRSLLPASPGSAESVPAPLRGRAAGSRRLRFPVAAGRSLSPSSGWSSWPIGPPTRTAGLFQPAPAVSEWLRPVYR